MDTVEIQSLAENLPAAGEMPSHDRVIRVRLAQRPATILHVGAEKTRGKLVFKFFDAPAVRVAKEKADHPVCENPVDKSIDNCAQPGLAAKLIEQSRRRGIFYDHVLRS
jgi:hypothetical protein